MSDAELVFIKCEVPPSAAERDREAQEASRRAASHHGVEWTNRDFDVLQSDLNDEHVAKRLGRTVQAVRTKRSGLRG